MEKLLFTIEEAAEVLSVSRSTVYDLVRMRLLDTVLIGRSRRVPASATGARRPAARTGKCGVMTEIKKRRGRRANGEGTIRLEESREAHRSGCAEDDRDPAI